MAIYSLRVDAATDIDRRMKQIALRNPGHPVSAARLAAEQEAAAIRAVATADDTERKAARLHLRTVQLRAANLDLDDAAARELARLQMEEAIHWPRR